MICNSGAPIESQHVYRKCEHCAYCGARLDIGPPRHICKEIIYGTAATPTPFIPFDLPAPPEFWPAAYKPKKIWAKEILDAIEHGRPL